jgi:hypothetical protein
LKDLITAITRKQTHEKHAAADGNKTIIIKAITTDVLVIAVCVLPILQDLEVEKLWVAFGQGQNLKWIPIYDISPSIGPEKSKSLLFFHAFTGCDVVSAFRGKGKKSAWQTWNVCPEASTVFFYRKLSQYPPVIGEDDQSILEKFVVTMHDRFSATDSTDVARLELFARKQRSYDSILPTQAALIQHIKRAAYQAGYIWGQATICQMETNSPADWGWKKQDDMWQIFWTALLPIAQSC